MASTSTNGSIDSSQPIQFSNKVDSALQEVIPSRDIFDQPDFNAIAFINQVFPSEDSLKENLDNFVMKLNKKIKNLDDEILTAVRKQSTSGTQARKDLEEAKNSIFTLFQKVQDIKQKAEQSEQMVQKITKDIKSLDYGKKNLTSTVKALRRLHMLVSAVDQVRSMAKKRQYKQVANSMEAINALVKDFEKYSDIPKVKELMTNIETIRTELKNQIFSDFKSMDALKEKHNSPETLLYEACQVIDALGDEARQQLITQFVKQQLTVYTMTYTGKNKESQLDNIQNRYNWCKLSLKNYDQQFSEIFPKSWSIPQEIAVEFALLTRNSLKDVLESNSAKDNLDAVLLHKALTSTIKFEKEMHSRYHVMTEVEIDRELNRTTEDSSDPSNRSEMYKTSDEVKRRFEMMKKKRDLERQKKTGEEQEEEKKKKKNTVAQKNYNFIGLISGVFEDYMTSYIQFEDKTMNEKLTLIMRRETWQADSDSSSSVDLFIYISKSLENCKAFSKGKTLFTLLQRVWKKYLNKYADMLLLKLPKLSLNNSALKDSREFFISLKELVQTSPNVEATTRLSEREEVVVCYIMRTADYCQNNLDAMEEEIRRTLEEPYNKDVTLGDEKSKFMRVLKVASDTLVLNMINAIESELQIKLLKTNWSAYENVGDQSAYVSAIIAFLNDCIPKLADEQNGVKSHLKLLCDTFIITFFNVYTNYLFKLKKISDAAAQQLLLDVTSLTNFLKNLLNVGTTPQNRRYDEDEVQIFARKVQNRASKIENILRVVLSPPESMLESFQTLLPDSSQTDYQKIQEMKGVSGTEGTTVMSGGAKAKSMMQKIVGGVDAANLLGNINILKKKTEDRG